MKIRASILVFAAILSGPAMNILAENTGAPALIPEPQKMELHDGTFEIRPDTVLQVDPASKATGDYLAGRLRGSTGFELRVDTIAGGPASNGVIVLTTQSGRKDFGVEGYELEGASNSVAVRAQTQAGLFYGAQTLLQLLPPEAFGGSIVRRVKWT